MQSPFLFVTLFSLFTLSPRGAAAGPNSRCVGCKWVYQRISVNSLSKPQQKDLPRLSLQQSRFLYPKSLHRENSSQDSVLETHTLAKVILKGANLGSAASGTDCKTA